jgi:hypothetical protein
MMCDLYVITRVLLFEHFGSPSFHLSFLSSGILVNMPTKLEIMRQENQARNQKLLKDLMNKRKKENVTLKQTAERRKSNPKKRSAPPKKRVAPRGELEESRPTKRARPETSQSGLRRSTRNAGKTAPDYQAESRTRLPRLVTTKIGMDHDRDPNRRSGKRIHDPYVVQPVTWEDSR